MKNAIILGGLGLAVSAAMLVAGFMAARAPAPQPVAQTEQAAPVQRHEVEMIVRNFLVENPEVLAEMQFVLEERQQEAERVSQIETIQTEASQIFNAEYDGVFGNPEGDVTVVEFFDYNCGFCKRALDDMEEMVEADPDLRFVLKEFPILGPDSQRAHVVSMAFRSLHADRYPEFHRALLSASGRATEDSAVRLARSLGADEEELRREMRNPDIPAAFAATYDLASRLSITGTPSYVIGDEIVFGAMGAQVLTEKVNLVRE